MTGPSTRLLTRCLLLVLAIGCLASLGALAQEVRLPSPEQIVGPPQGQPLSGPTLELRTKEVASLLRCPTCQGLSIWDSPAAMAVNMKRQVGELVAAGYTEEQILDYFEASYGEFVRLNPKLGGINWLVWLAPVLILAGGVWAILAFLRNSRASEPQQRAQTDLDEDLDPELEPYLRRVRELAYGWPGGVPPASKEESS
jgi:cytochrome c-type biogenesis protein CcmH